MNCCFVPLWATHMDIHRQCHQFRVDVSMKGALGRGWANSAVYSATQVSSDLQPAHCTKFQPQ